MINNTNSFELQQEDSVKEQSNAEVKGKQNDDAIQNTNHHNAADDLSPNQGGFE